MLRTPREGLVVAIGPRYTSSRTRTPTTRARSKQLAYDVLFDLFAAVEPVSTEQVFLDAYRDLLALGDGAVTTGGYAPKLLTDWMKARRAAGEIVEQGGSLVLSDAHRQAVWTSLSTYGG